MNKISRKDNFNMANPTITLSNNQIVIPQYSPLNRREIDRQLGVNAYNQKGVSLNSNYVLDLSRIDTQTPGTYHGSVNVTDTDGTTAFMNFTVIVTPASKPVKPQSEDNDKKPTKNKKKKWLIIGIVILALLLGLFAIKQHNHHVQQERQTQQQVQANKNNIKSNAEQNAAMQKQIDGLKKAQAEYANDKDLTAYKNRLYELEDENQRLQQQTHDGEIDERLNKINDSIQQASQDPDQGQKYIDQATDDAHLNNFFNQFMARLTNWLNS